ncbi:MAG TPA: tetratricopeptide repeat protein [Bryobacteraceae bacterium]|nr:tetratricopeptide repeat protein [Bryobacteraceae bacterium]
MAAINAAGYDADLGSAANSPLREMVRREIEAAHPASLEKLRQFFADHRQQDWSAELSQYISFALCVDSPPEFKFRYRTNELPPDVARLDGFRELLVQFSREAKLDELWTKAQPAFEEAIARYHPLVLAAVGQVNAYLRSSSSGAMSAHFQIYVDLLGAPNQVHTRSYKDDYFVVVTPSAEPQAESVRHAFLHFQVDPLSLRYAENLEKKRSLIDFAQGAPALEPYYKDDFGLLATECLIKAIEARLAPAADRQGMVTLATGEGYILAPVFSEELPAYEKQEQSMRFYYPELIKGIDLKRESARLDQVKFLSERPVKKSKVPVERPVELTGAARTLEDAERLYTARDLEKAKTQYLNVLKETGDKPMHAKAYYGLARVAALQNDPETAVQLFEKTLQSSPDPQVMAWAHVYLGRLADASGERDQATVHYQAAMDVKGGSEAARKAAEKGLQKAFTR